MNIISMLTKKRNKGKLTKEEMEYFVKEYNKGSIEDYQATGLVMAMCINGLDKEEIKDLTVAMAESGEMLDMSDVSENYIEKHSIGGVGDKVSLILLPILAALDIPAGKLSGKGIGISGSTADKLSSIPGCRANITIEEYKDNLIQYIEWKRKQAIHSEPDEQNRDRHGFDDKSFKKEKEV